MEKGLQGGALPPRAVFVHVGVALWNHGSSTEAYLGPSKEAYGVALSLLRRVEKEVAEVGLSSLTLDYPSTNGTVYLSRSFRLSLNFYLTHF